MCRARTRTDRDLQNTQVNTEVGSPPRERPSSFTKHLGTPCLLCLAVVVFLAFLQQ